MGDNSWLVLAIGNVTVDLENLDFVTSNRLSLGRNKDWNPTGSLHVKTIQNWFWKIMKQYSILGSKFG